MAAVGMILPSLLAACTAPGSPSPAGGQQAHQEPPRTKTITVGVTSAVRAFGIMGERTAPLGGWGGVNEAHSAALISSDVDSRAPIGRLAEKVPSLEDGSITLLPDGRMRVVYRLRPGITWQDGTPFGASDLVFTYRLSSDAGIPNPFRDAINQVQSVEETDDHTVVVNFRGPYYLGAALGLTLLWPLPRHLLGDAYERYLASGNAAEVVNLPYWTTEYLHLGPFRLASFDPGEEVVFHAYEGYFLGRPKVDVIRVRILGDQNALFSNLLAGSIDVFLDTSLNTELGFQLLNRWGSGNQGTVHVKQASHRMLAPQWRAAVLQEPAILDARIRMALYRAIDRETLSEALQGGHRELAAWEILRPSDLHFEVTKDALRPYAYDPDRARSGLIEAGWSPRADGGLHHASDGRAFRSPIWGVDVVSREVPILADYWRRVGLQVEEFIIPPAQARDPETRALYPGWEVTSQSGGDGILGKLEGPAASAQTRWVGNRGGYEDPRAQALVNAYRTSLSERDRAPAMKAASDFVAAELPFLVLFAAADHLGARSGVKALEDHRGGDSAGGPYGTYTRNAHLWDVEAP